MTDDDRLIDPDNYDLPSRCRNCGNQSVRLVTSDGEAAYPCRICESREIERL